MATVPVPHLTPQQYLDIERASATRHEYIDGVMYSMAGGTPQHADIAANLLVELLPRARSRGCRATASDFRVRISPDGPFFYPDITVRCDETKTSDEFRDNLLNPVLIAEVLSKSTEAFDRGEKFEQYSRIESLREYVLVSTKKPRIETFLRGVEGKWLLTTFDGINAICRFESIGCAIPLSAIYLDIAFE